MVELNDVLDQHDVRMNDIELNCSGILSNLAQTISNELEIRHLVHSYSRSDFRDLPDQFRDPFYDGKTLVDVVFEQKAALSTLTSDRSLACAQISNLEHHNDELQDRIATLEDQINQILLKLEN